MADQSGPRQVFLDLPGHGMSAVRGAITHRQQLQRVLDALDEGDVLLVKGRDRLARSTRDLLNTLA
jgi:DNA invertase Pin-like site-specific DNA recombinase